MFHLLGWVLQLDGADNRNISKPLQISDKFFGWQVTAYIDAAIGKISADLIGIISIYFNEFRDYP
jgi:hypothetical protein